MPSSSSSWPRASSGKPSCFRVCGNPNAWKYALRETFNPKNGPLNRVSVYMETQVSRHTSFRTYMLQVAQERVSVCVEIHFSALPSAWKHEGIPLADQLLPPNRRIVL